MGKVGKREQAAIEAVAKQFSATWEIADGAWPDAYLTTRGKRIAVDIVAIKAKIADTAKPRLRFDKSVLRLFDGVRAAVTGSVPDGTSVLFTVTAPIRLRAKTAGALEVQIRDGLARRAAKVEIEDTIFGNDVRIRIAKRLSAYMPKVIGFVHNPETGAERLLDLTQALLKAIGTAVDKRPPKTFTDDCWLVIADDGGASYLETWRHVCSQFPSSAGIKKILTVLAGDRVETLLG
jgi:hypothetical protein